MFNPVDFGHPVILKLNDIEEDFDLDEIIVPSVTFALELDDYPLTVGVGYQKGRELELSSGTENRVILFFCVWYAFVQFTLMLASSCSQSMFDG